MNTHHHDRIGAALRAETTVLQPGPECIPLDALMPIIDRSGAQAALKTEMEHLKDCPYCLNQLVELRATLWEAERLRTPVAYERGSAPGGAGWSFVALLRRWGSGAAWRNSALAFAAGALAVLLVFVPSLRSLREARTREFLLNRRLQEALSQSPAGPTPPAAQEFSLPRLQPLTSHQLARLPALAPVLSSDQSERQSFKLRPNGTKIATTSPTLQWNALDEAISYQCLVARIDKTGQPLLRSPEINSTQWTVTSPLTPDGVYEWSVRCRLRTGEVEAPRAGFIVAGGREITALADLHLELLRMYASSDHLDAAARELEMIPAGSPQRRAADRLLEARRRSRSR